MRVLTIPRQLRGMRWVWNLGGLSAPELSRRTVSEVFKDDIFSRAAQLAFYFFLSLFPLLILAAALTGYVLGSDPALYSKLLEHLSEVMPDAAFAIVRKSIQDVVSRTGAGSISFGLIFTLWSGSAGAVSLIEGLNAAYGINEFRLWWKRRLVAAALTISLLILGIAALAVILTGRRFGIWLAGVTNSGQWFLVFWPIAQWLLAAVFMLLALGLVYLLAPNLKEQRWQAIMPGSLVALVSWVLTSVGFKLYLTFFESYSKTYGSLGAVIVLLLWMYMTGVSILLGGEVNSEIWNAAASAGAPEARRTREGRS